MSIEKGSFEVKVGLAKMLKGGVIMDVTPVQQAKIAEQSIIYTLQISEISWGSLSTDRILNHGLTVKYYF